MVGQHIDAVEVVRCKDCICADRLSGGAEEYFHERCMLCALGRCKPSIGFSVVSPDDFCSDGVRRDEKES